MLSNINIEKCHTTKNNVKDNQEEFTNKNVRFLFNLLKSSNNNIKEQEYPEETF